MIKETFDILVKGIEKILIWIKDLAFDKFGDSGDLVLLGLALLSGYFIERWIPNSQNAWKKWVPLGIIFYLAIRLSGE